MARLLDTRSWLEHPVVGRGGQPIGSKVYRHPIHISPPTELVERAPFAPYSSRNEPRGDPKRRRASALSSAKRFGPSPCRARCRSRLGPIHFASPTGVLGAYGVQQGRCPPELARETIRRLIGQNLMRSPASRAPQCRQSSSFRLQLRHSVGRWLVRRLCSYCSGRGDLVEELQIQKPH